VSDLIHDSLTGLMTPYYFYESAWRLRSWAKRREQPLSLIAIDLQGVSLDDLIRCARELNAELRGGDLLARMQDAKFLLLLLGDLQSARHLIFRLANRIKPKLKFQATELTSDEHIGTAMARIEI
jgi:GGDEF domain-containing protein